MLLLIYQSAAVSGITGVLVAQETADTAIFNGAISGVAGRLVAQEAADVALFTGNVPFLYVGTINATEAPDQAIFRGMLGAVPISASPYPSPYDYGWYRGRPGYGRKYGRGR